VDCRGCRSGEHSEREIIGIQSGAERLEQQKVVWVARARPTLGHGGFNGFAEIRAFIRETIRRAGDELNDDITKIGRPKARPTAWGRSSARRKKDPTPIADLKECVRSRNGRQSVSDDEVGGARACVRCRRSWTAAPVRRPSARLLRDQKYGLRSHARCCTRVSTMPERNRQFEHSASNARLPPPVVIHESAWTRRKRNSWVSSKTRVKRGARKRPRSTITIFPGDSEGRAATYGVYDPERNEGSMRDGPPVTLRPGR